MGQLSIIKYDRSARQLGPCDLQLEVLSNIRLKYSDCYCSLPILCLGVRLCQGPRRIFYTRTLDLLLSTE
jgi:hypothetical protein